MSSSRQLAAIMFTDIVGYTALMGRDEQKAFQLLKKNREIQKPLIKHFNGTWIKELGDGVLASFHTVTDAVLCSSAIHKACDSVDGLQLRIGIHQGEVVFENNDVFGDGVNIASRLQALAPIGKTWVSEAVYKNIVNKKEFITAFAGEETLKNVSGPVKIYEVNPADDSLLQADYIHQIKKGADGRHRVKRIIALAIVFLLAAGLVTYFLLLKQKPDNHSGVDPVIEKSIAIIPFRNLSNDPQQEYFVEGMMDEILNHLHKIGGLNVISRTSSMVYKDSKKTSKQIASELGVANLLEASVQKDGDHIRIIVQLINGKNDQHLWSNTYDNEFKDVFRVQSEIAQEIAASLKLKIDPATKSRIEHIPTKNIAAYNIYLQARERFLKESQRVELLNQVIALDSTFAPAYADLALYWIYRGSHGGDLNAKQALDSSRPLLKKAAQLDNNLSSVHAYLAMAHLWFEWNFEAAEQEWNKFFQLNPSNPSGSYWTSSYMDFLHASGRFQEALNFSLKNLEQDRTYVGNWTDLATGYYYMNQTNKAFAVLDSAWLLFQRPNTYRLKAWLFCYLGKHQQVIDHLNKYFVSYPDNRKIPRHQAWLAIAYFHTGSPGETEKILDSFQSLSKKSPVGSPAFHMAMIYSATGRPKLALQWLEKAYRDHEVEMYWLKVEPIFISLRSDKGFQDIMNRIGYPK